MSTRFDVYSFDPENPTCINKIAEGRPYKSSENFTIYIPKIISLAGRLIMLQNSEKAVSVEYFEALYDSKSYEPDHELLVFDKYRWKKQTKYKPYVVGHGLTVEPRSAYVLDIHKNISVSDRMIMPPKSTKSTNYQALGSYYMSAADEFGM